MPFKPYKYHSMCRFLDVLLVGIRYLIEEYIQLPGEPPVGTTIRCKEELRFLRLSEDPVREQICTRMITAQNGI